MKKKLILLSLISVISNSEVFETKGSNIKIEMDYGTKISFGMDEIENLFGFFEPVLNLALPKEFEDYKPVYKGGKKPSNVAPSNLVYIPYVSGDVVDLTLALRYLSKGVKFNKELTTKVDFEKLGLKLAFNLIGVETDYENYMDNYKFDKAKFSVISNNKYLKGRLNYYHKGENKKASLTNIKGYEQDDYSRLNYDFNLDLFNKYNLKPTLNLSGIDRKFEFRPELTYSKDGFYAKTGVAFSKGTENNSIKDEISKVKNVAPGYDKIEYFRKWTLKDQIPNLEKPEDYLKDEPDYIKAQVSGFKGTRRILGLYSGSLFGDNPISYMFNSFTDNLSKNPKLKLVDEFLKEAEKNTLGNTDFIKKGYQFYLDSLKVNYVNELNKLVVDVSKDLYNKIGIDLDKEHSEYNIINQIPAIFKPILPGINPSFHILGIDTRIMDPQWLYFKGLTSHSPSISGMKFSPDSPNSNTNDNSNNSDKKQLVGYKKEKEFHTIGMDFERYIFNSMFQKYKVDTITGNIEKLTQGSVLEKIGSFFELFKMKDHVLNTNLKNFLSDPARSVYGIDILRGIYFHESEKSKNVKELEKKIKNINFDEKRLKSTYYPHFNIQLGYANDIVRFDLNSNINKYYKLENKTVSFSKRENDLNLKTALLYKPLIFSNSINLNYALNNFKTKQDKLIYDTVDFRTNTYLGLFFRPSEKWDLEFGLSHLFELKYINPREIVFENKKYEKEVAKRDKDNNPIDIDGKSIKVAESTEFELIDKYVAKEKNKDISKRRVHPTMMLAKEKKGATDSVYGVYNILTPRFKVGYRPSKNIEFSNELIIPVGFKFLTPSGFNLALSSNVKYIIDDNDLNIFQEKEKFKIKTSGDVLVGQQYFNNKNMFYSKYDVNLDTSFIRGHLYGLNSVYNYGVEINPLVLNFKLRPKITFTGNKDINKINFVLEAIGKDDFSAQFGLSKPLAYSKDIKKEIFDNIEYILTDKKRTTTERKAIKDLRKENKISDDLTSNLIYTKTPHFVLRKESGDFKYRIKFDSLVGKKIKEDISITKNEYKIDEKEYGNLDNILDKMTNGERYITKTTYKEGDDIAIDFFKKIFGNVDIGFKKNLYFIKLPRYASDIIKENKFESVHKKYDFNLDASYDKKGFFANTDLNVDYNYFSYKEKSKNEDKKYIKPEIFVIESTKFNNYAQLKDQVTKKIKVEAKNHETKKKYTNPDGTDMYIDPFLKLSNTKEENEKNVKEHLKLRGEYGYQYEKIEYPDALLKEMVNEEYSYSLVKNDFNNLTTTKIKFNTNSNIGYNFIIKDRICIAPSLNHRFNLDYTTAESILYNDYKLFGSHILTYDNILTPKMDFKFKVIKGISFNANLGVPILFTQDKKQKASFTIGTNLQVKW